MELMSSLDGSIATQGVPVCTTHEIRHEVCSHSLRLKFSTLLPKHKAA